MCKTQYVQKIARAAIARIESMSDVVSVEMRESIQKDIDNVTSEMLNPTLSSLRNLCKIGKLHSFEVDPLLKKINAVTIDWP